MRSALLYPLIIAFTCACMVTPEQPNQRVHKQTPKQNNHQAGQVKKAKVNKIQGDLMLIDDSDEWETEQHVSDESIQQQLQQQTNSKEFIPQNSAEQARVHIDLGKQLAKKRQYQSALTEYLTAIALEPTDASHYRLAGEVARKSRQYQYALELYQKATELAPYDYRAYGSIGMISTKLKRYSEAINSFKKIHALNPKEYTALHELAYLYFTTDDYQNCAESLKAYDALIANLRGDLLSQRSKNRIESQQRKQSRFRAAIKAQQLPKRAANISQ